MGTDNPIAQNRPDRPMHVADGHLDSDLFTAFDALGDLFDNSPVQMIFEQVVLAVNVTDVAPVGGIRLGENGREVQPPSLPVIDGLAAAEPADLPDHVFKFPEAQLSHFLPDLLGHEEHEPLEMFRLTGKPLA